MKKTRLIAASLLLAFAPPAIGFMPRTAFAQPADDPTIKAARARFQEGVAFYDKGEFENARAAFLQAYALRKHPAVLLNLAQSCLRSGHALEASKYFQQYLRESQNISPAQRADAERGLSDARQKLGRLEISAPTGATVLVDGEAVGAAPLTEPVDVDPGSHKVKAGTDEKTVSVSAGQRQSVRFEAAGGGTTGPPPTPTPAPTPAPTPTPTPTPEPTPTTPPAGDTGAGASVSTDADKKSEGMGRPANMVPFWVGIGVAGVGAIVAVAVGIIAKSSAQNSADSVAAAIRAQPDAHAGICSNPPSKFIGACAALADDNSKVDTDATVGNIGLGVGIAGAAFAVIWYLAAPRKEKDKGDANPTAAGIQVTPTIGARNGGLSLSGSF